MWWWWFKAQCRCALFESYLFFRQGGRESHGSRRTCQTRTDLCVLTKGMMISRCRRQRGLGGDRRPQQAGECSVDTQLMMQLYPRARRLPATWSLPKRLAFPSLNSNRSYLLPRRQSSTRCWAWMQLRTQCTIWLERKAERPCKLFCGWWKERSNRKSSASPSSSKLMNALAKERKKIPVVSRP